MKIIALELIGRFLAALTGSSREVAFSLGVKESMSLLKRLYKSNPGYLDKGSCTYYVITRAHNLCHDNRQLNVITINRNRSAIKINCNQSGLIGLPT